MKKHILTILTILLAVSMTASFSYAGEGMTADITGTEPDNPVMEETITISEETEPEAEANDPILEPETESEAEADDLILDPETESEADDLTLEPETESEADDPILDLETESEADDLNLEPETEAEADDLILEPETESEADDPVRAAEETEFRETETGETAAGESAAEIEEEPQSMSAGDTVIEPEEDSAAEPEEDLLSVPEWITEDLEVTQTAEFSLPQDSDSLLLGYFRAGSSSYGTPMLFSSYNGNKLSGFTKELYDGLKTQVEKVASAQTSSTSYEYTFAAESLADYRWTAEDLGVDSLLNYDEETKTYKINQTAANLAAQSLYNANLAEQSLIRDCPYELFWFGNKISNTRSYTPSVFTDSESGTKVMTFTKLTLTVKLLVSADYQGSDYVTDLTKIQSVQTARVNAAAIVAAASGLDDRSKLDYYRQQICSLVTYNDSAASSASSYGDPWQLIYVFDQDPTTNVVCEGYAKSFQYLCDESSFQGEVIAYSVAGTLKTSYSSIGHLWNIVHMNGANYMVDVTNCDGDTPSTELFLVRPEKGSLEDGYVFPFGSTELTYSYNGDTRLIYADSELEIALTHDHVWKTVTTEPNCLHKGIRTTACTICGEKQSEEEFGELQPHTEVTDAAVNPTCTQEGKTAGSHCSVCGEILKAQESIPMIDHDYQKGVCSRCGNIQDGFAFVKGIWGWYQNQQIQTSVTGLVKGTIDSAEASYYVLNGILTPGCGWVKLDQNWYYIGEDAIPLKGWQKIGNYYYYLNQTTGQMQEGWLNLKGKTYYLKPGGNGRMLTGWQKIDGAYYYFRPGDSGLMLTGWQKINGSWYYLDPTTGQMQEGWLVLNGKTYYLKPNGSGRMLTGWQKIDKSYYYFQPGDSGLMLTGWRKIDDYWYYLDPVSGIMEEGWAEIKGSYYYFRPNGSGKMQTGWQKIDGSWYYFAASGKMKTGWQKVSGSWYYLDSSGKMQTGWLQSKDNWYFLNGKGQMQTGWQKISGNWYYFNGSGVMLTGSQTINGKTYQFTNDGVWQRSAS